MKQINFETGTCFFRVDKEIDLISFLHARDFSPLDIEGCDLLIKEWLRFGSVYLEGKRQRENILLQENQIVRLHTRKKRYPAHQLGMFIIEDNCDFLVLDKPAGVPTHPTLDNYLENAKSLLEVELRIPLYTTHRLDVPTQGLLIFAKTQPAQAKINKLFSLRRVEKIYRTRNDKLLPVGLQTHFMDPQSRVPKVISDQAQENWWVCQLHIDRSWTLNSGFAHEMTLLTGKTHQIRAQMKALGAPIQGDPTYGGREQDELQLECLKLSFNWRGNLLSFIRPRSLLGL